MSAENQKAVTAAQNLLRQHQYSIPVDVHQVALDLGLTIVERDLEDQVSGMLVIKRIGGIIAVNEHHHPNRQRFTIAHEIGHYQLHRDDNNVFIDATRVFFRDTASAEGHHLQEIVANTFAAELLMPEQHIREILRNQPIDAFDDTAVRRIATQFGVSSQALTIRLTRLDGLIPLG